jgi:TolB-like protein
LRNRWLIPAGLAVVVAVTAGAVLGIQGWRKSSGAAFDEASIAVLPFDNLGGDPKWERIADGITEDIITDLSQSDHVLVISRHSTNAYKGKSVDVRQVGADLGVRFVLEGSVQASGDRVRITAQLVDAATGEDLWSERYDRAARTFSRYRATSPRRSQIPWGPSAVSFEKRNSNSSSTSRPTV